jgi:LacI family transcriptional regulator
VTVDFYQESQRAVTHLREHGHRRIALVLDDERAWADERRRAGYEDILRAYSGSEFRALTLTTARQTLPEIAAAIRQANCTACVNFSERLGVALIHHLITQERLNVPGDLSVVALDAEPATGCFAPPLTALSEPHAELAERAILLLAGKALDPGERTVVTLPAQLIERASVRGPRKT